MTTINNQCRYETTINIPKPFKDMPESFKTLIFEGLASDPIINIFDGFDIDGIHYSNNQIIDRAGIGAFGLRSKSPTRFTPIIEKPNKHSKKIFCKICHKKNCTHL